MGLSRGGGAVAFQKIVNTVGDLPSPLDAEPGMRIIVRETEEVYGLNRETRMWEPIGTLKKVGGKKPEEIAAHVDSEGNPHKTSLQDVLSAGTAAQVDEEILITGKGPMSQVRLLSGSAALRYGPDAGSKSGVLWMNIGGGKKTIMRAVNSDGDDMFVLDTDGLVSGGSATFYGGFKGPAHFEDEITAAEGVHGADGFDLVLSGDKGVVLHVGDEVKAILTSKLMTLASGLEMNGDLRLHGSVGSDLIPSGDLQLGHPKARWAKAAMGDLDLDGQLVVHVAPNAKKAPLQVTGSVPGDGAVLTAGGALGLGTDKPDAKLDVRGEVLVGGKLRLGAEGLTCGDWSTSYSTALAITHKGKDVLRCSPDGLTLSGSVKVNGGLSVGGQLAVDGLAGQHNELIAFSNGTITHNAKLHTFTGPLKVDSHGPRPLEVPGLTVDSGDLLGSGELKGWKAARLSKELTVGSATLSDNGLKVPGEFSLEASALVTKGLRLVSERPKVEVLNELRLQGSGGSATFAMGGPNCGLDLEGKHWELNGLNKLGVDNLSASTLGAGHAELDSGRVKSSLQVDGTLKVGGLALKKVSEEVEFEGFAQTKFEIPAGVKIEAVVVKLLSDVVGPRFLQVGDLTDPARFASATASLRAGSLIRGLAHWETGRVVQKAPGPITVSGDAPAKGKVLVTVHYVDPAAL